MKKIPPSERISKEIDDILQKGTPEHEDLLSTLIRKSVKKLIQEVSINILSLTGQKNIHGNDMCYKHIVSSGQTKMKGSAGYRIFDTDVELCPVRDKMFIATG